jgi:hypothetical protein
MFKLLIFVVICSTTKIDRKIIIRLDTTIIHTEWANVAFTKISQNPPFPKFLIDVKTGIIVCPKNLEIGSIFHLQYKTKTSISGTITIIVEDDKVKCVNIKNTTKNVIQLSNNYNYLITEGNLPKLFDINNGLVTVIAKLIETIYILTIRGVDDIKLYIVVNNLDFCPSPSPIVFDINTNCVSINNNTKNVMRVHVNDDRNVTYSITSGSTFAIDKFGFITVKNHLINSSYELILQAFNGVSKCTTLLNIYVDNPQYCNINTQCVEINYNSTNIIQMAASAIILNNANFEINDTGFVYTKNILDKNSTYEILIQMPSGTTILHIGVDVPNFCILKSKYRRCREKCRSLYWRQKELPVNFVGLCNIFCTLLQ